MIKKGPEVKLNVQPIIITLYHEYVFEGPCRFGTAEQLTAEYDQMMNAERSKLLEQDILNNLGDKVCLRPAIHIERTEEFLIRDEDLDAMSAGSDEVDVYLIGALCRMTDLLIPFAQRVKKPLVYCPTPARPWHTIGISALTSRGLEMYGFLTWGRTIDFLEVLRVKKALSATKVLCAARFGTTRTVSGMDNFLDLDYVTKVLGTNFCFMNPHELLDQTHIGDPSGNHTIPGRAGLNPTDADVAEMNALTDELIANADQCDMTREDVFSSVRAYVSIKKFLDHYDCNAFCAPCPDICATRRYNNERFTFCLNHSLMGENGIPSGCEYDLSATLSMMILSCFMQAPAYMGNTTHDPIEWMERGKVIVSPMMHDMSGEDYKEKVMADPENTIFTWHAVAKRNIKGFGTEPAPYCLRPFTASGFGATIRYDFNRDIGQTVTMTRIDPACKKLFVSKGTIVAGRGYGDMGCSIGVFIRVNNGYHFFEKQAMFGNHIPLVYGDCFDKVCSLGEMLGLEVVTE